MVSPGTGSNQSRNLRFLLNIVCRRVAHTEKSVNTNCDYIRRRMAAFRELSVI